MKRQICLLALLFCSACETGNIEKVVQLLANAPKAGEPAFTHIAPPSISLNDPDDAAKKIVAAINTAFKSSGTPTGALYGHWRSESGEVYGDGGHAGDCSALDQYRIIAKWKPNRGKANIAALEHIAKNLGRDVADIKGSCGNSTLWKRGTTFGGALGPPQVMAASWVSDPRSKDKNPFNLLDALEWIGRRDRQYFNKAPSPFRTNTLKRWEYSVRSYYGALGSDDDEEDEKAIKRQEVSLLYYQHVSDHWKRWSHAPNKVALVKSDLMRRVRQKQYTARLALKD